MSISKKVQDLSSELTRNKPVIFLALGIGGFMGAIVSAVKSTPKALDLVANRKEQLNTDSLSVPETIKATWKCYIPTVSLAVASTALIVGGHKEQMNRTAAIGTAYSLTREAFRTFKESAIEEVGNKKNDIIEGKAAQKLVDQKPPIEQSVILTETGNTLMLDGPSGRYFRGDIDKIKKSENDINRRLRSDDWATLNDWYYEIGLPNIELGDFLGWDVGQDTYLEVSYSAALTDVDTPVVVLSYQVCSIFA